MFCRCWCNSIKLIMSGATKGTNLKQPNLKIAQRFIDINPSQKKSAFRHVDSKSNEELKRTLSLSNALIHQSTTIPFHKGNMVTTERCLLVLARYLSDLQKGTASLLMTPQGAIDRDYIQQITSRLWQRIKQDPKAIISGRIYSQVIDILSRSGRAEQAEEILKEMVEWTRSDLCAFENHSEKPEFNCLHSALFGTIINAYAKTEPLHGHGHDNKGLGVGGLTRAEALLQYQIQLYHEWNKPLRIEPNIKCFTALLDAYSRKGDAARAEAILLNLLNRGISVTTTTFNVVIVAWARASAPVSTEAIHKLSDLPARNAERILLSMEEWSKGKCRPDVFSYSSVIKAWADSHVQPYGVQRAEEIVMDMENGAGHVIPNTKCYNIIINAFARMGDVASSERLLNHLLNVSSSKQSNPIFPDIVTFNTVLKAMSRKIFVTKENGNKQNYGLKADELLNIMEKFETQGLIKVDTVSYNTVLRTWCNLKSDSSALDHALQLLHRMEEKGIQDRISYNTLLATYADYVNDFRKSSKSKRSHICPSLEPWEVAQKADELLNRMESDQKTTSPDIVSYNTMIKIWSKLGEVDRARSILQRIQKSDSIIKPTPMTYVSLIDAYAQSSSPKAAERAKAILQEMNTALKSTPTIAYNAYLNVLCKSQNMEEAEAVLESMENSEVSRPDVLSYCTIINGWTRNSTYDKALNAFQILKRLLDRFGKDGNLDKGSIERIRNAHNMSIMACAFTGNKMPQEYRTRAMEISHEILGMMRTSRWFLPTLSTYELLFAGYSIWLNEMHDDKKCEIILTSFQKCMEDGFVNHVILERFTTMISENFIRSLQENGFHVPRKEDKIPSAWSRNIL